MAADGPREAAAGKHSALGQGLCRFPTTREVGTTARFNFFISQWCPQETCWSATRERRCCSLQSLSPERSSSSSTESPGLVHWLPIQDRLVGRPRRARHWSDLVSAGQGSRSIPRQPQGPSRLSEEARGAIFQQGSPARKVFCRGLQSIVAAQ